MKIAVVHNSVKDESALDERDVLIQAEAVCSALQKLGHIPITMACTLDLLNIKNQLEKIKPDMVFNLVESLEGTGRLIHLFPFVLDALKIPYTGSCALAILNTSHKIIAKELLTRAGLLTPEWICSNSKSLSAPQNGGQLKTWIIKSVWEHASVGLDEENIITGFISDIQAIMEKRASELGGECFAEEYIDGREFNLSVLAGENKPVVLAPAEIIFEGYAPEKPHIVGYRAKWKEDSYEYNHTPRQFDFTAKDKPLIEELQKIAIECWHIFGLKGYARVDFRADKEGKIWILEINTNPCLSPDAGFPAAVERYGMSFIEAIEKIVVSCQKESGQKESGQLSVVSYRKATEHCSLTTDHLFFRFEPVSQDKEKVRRLAESTGFFYPAEIDVAVELIDERLSKGEKSGYFFVFAEQQEQLAGYTCYGPIACTVSSFDLYWIAVHPDFQGRGIGRLLMNETEKIVRNMGGTRIYIETSFREKYAGTRAFYESCGYRIESVLDDFYGPGDGRATFCKVLSDSAVTDQ